MYKLYSMAGSCSTAITVLLERLGVNYEVIQRDSVENYSKISPTNQVPALVDKDLVITEGAAITLYLLEKHCDIFNDIKLSSEVKINYNVDFYQKLMFVYATLHPAYSTIFTIKKLDENHNVQLMQKLADKVSHLWEIIEKQLEGNKFMFGEKPTIIDYLITIYSNWGKYFPELNIYLGNNVQNLVKHISQTPEFIAACKKENLNWNK
ncbi:glutathione S-transferase family protein [Francisella sp. TX07-6608]|uniref:glutathione S-transferase family protein n=1 Tax=Francisella sp. TX07-6608 TaxID=573568 RepID=UPI0008F9B6CF|nr:glutathione S-transferase [Francisella sp. TX07-6608]OIN82907.1 hypothetical protein KX00_2015 [Francisella sp. TX07-6608]